MRPTKRWCAYAAVALVVFFASYVELSPSSVLLTMRQAVASMTFDQKYVPVAAPFDSGTEVVMVYVGGGNCAPSNALKLPQQIEDIKSLLKDAAEMDGSMFRAIGVALDDGVQDGFRHLRKFGEFDELRVGGGAVSDAAMEYLWQGFPGTVATPQVIVLRRIRHAPDDRRAPLRYSVDDATEIMRFIGLDEISSWLEPRRVVQQNPSAAEES